MLTLFATHIITSACCLWSGYLFYKLFNKNPESRPLIFYLVSGLMMLTLATQIFVLFFPIGLLVQLAFGSVLLLTALLKWEDCKLLFKKLMTEFSAVSTLTAILFLVTWLIILLINAGPAMMDDTESYHIQSIKWIQEYGTVPGLVNLHERLGFNSSWFSSVALFGFSKNTSGGYSALNGVLSLWLAYWFISKYNQLFKINKYSASFALLIVFAGCLAIWPLLRGNAATANYDFIATAIVLILFAETFLTEEKQFSPGAEWLLWPVYLFTVRIINFPLLLLSIAAVIFYFRKKNPRAFVSLIILCLLLIVPFLARNILLTGYPFYPAAYFHWFPAGWQADPQVTERLLEYIKYYNRVSTAYFDIEQTKTLGAAWIPAWFQHLFLFDKILVAGGVAGLLGSVVLLFSRKKYFNKNSVIFLAAITLWLICWFIISPDPRFVYGCLLAGIFIIAYRLTNSIKNHKIEKLFTNAFVVILLATLVYYLVSKPINQIDYRNWITPALLPQPPVQEVMIDGIIFRIPEPVNNNWNARCYGTALPCIYKIDPRLQPRGKTIRSGFRLKK